MPRFNRQSEFHLKGIKILLADDHTLFRKALRKLIATLSFDAVIMEASDGREAVEALPTLAPDLVLLDIQMPNMGGLEALRLIRERHIQTKVVILTQFDEESLILYALQLGANGFLRKTCNPEELETAIVEVVLHGHYYNQCVREAIENNLSSTSAFSNLNITPREFQVLVLLKDGKSNKEVATKLGLTQRTVESYRKTLLKKTRCLNTANLISLAYRTGMLPK